jgi:NAD(P)-dependent dehydrogenase (short-subunit alcohol dehydrogenase family)
MKPLNIVITGVTRGLGRAMTEEFIQRGHVVAGCGRSAEQISELQERFAKPNAFRAVDVTSDAEVAAWAQEVIANVGVPDYLINNAALINRNAPLWKVPVQEFSNVIDINIKGVTNVIRHFAPSMVAKNFGVIVNFSSGWGRSTDAEVAPYCATKWAIEGLTQSLAQELPDRMAAVALNPGIIDTDMLRSSFSGAAGTFPSPREWAKRAVPFILSITTENAAAKTTVP